MCMQGRNRMGSPYTKSIIQMTHLQRKRWQARFRFEFAIYFDWTGNEEHKTKRTVKYSFNLWKCQVWTFYRLWLLHIWPLKWTFWHLKDGGRRSYWLCRGVYYCINNIQAFGHIHKINQKVQSNIKADKKRYKALFYSLSDLLLGAVPPQVIHALREVLYEPDALGDADLLLLRQLSGQSGLTGCWVIDGYMDLLLQKMRQGHI